MNISTVIHFSRASFDDTPNFSPVKEKIAHFPLIQEHYGFLSIGKHIDTIQVWGLFFFSYNWSCPSIIAPRKDVLELTVNGSTTEWIKGEAV
nr:hypothetical protein CFP56_42760 [Quercus suber]